MAERSVTPRGRAAWPHAVGGQPFARPPARPARRSAAAEGRPAHGADAFALDLHRAGAAHPARPAAGAGAAPALRSGDARTASSASPRRTSRWRSSPSCWRRLRGGGARRVDRMDGPRETMLLEVAEGQLDAAIAPAGLRLPAGIAAEPIGALRWRCFGRSGSPGLRALGRARLGAVAACRRAGRRPAREPGQYRGGARPASAARSRAGCRTSRSIAPVLAASDLLRPCPRRRWPARLARSASTGAACRSPSSPCRMSCCGRRAGQRSRGRLAAQAPAATGEKTLCKCG